MYIQQTTRLRHAAPSGLCAYPPLTHIPGTLGTCLGGGLPKQDQHRSLRQMLCYHQSLPRCPTPDQKGRDERSFCSRSPPTHLSNLSIQTMGIHQKHQPATLHAAENASRISLNKGGRGSRRGNNRDSSQRILAYESNPISCFCRCSLLSPKPSG